MPFIIRVPGHPEIEDLDFTLDDLDSVERESGVIWVLASPFKSAKVAKAYLKVAYRRHGLDPDEVDRLTQRQMRGWLDFRPDDDAAEPDGRPTKGRKAPKSRGSSSTSRTATTGPQPSPAPSG